jgi:UDPglucose--hexose-1-phosphate uridylyltransferase
VPFAPRFPFECWILPIKHSADFFGMKETQLKQFSAILKNTLIRLQTVFKNLPYNFVIHTAPFNFKGKRYYHWHMEIMPRLTKIAGFEWGSGFYINETSPEKAAEYLRNTDGGEF